MGFLGSQRPVVVIGDLRIDRDADVCKVLHQTVGIGFRNQKTALFDPSVTGSRFRECFNAPTDDLNIPSRVPAGLLQHRLVVRVKPEEFIGKVIFRDILDLQFNTLFALLVGKEDCQLLTCPQLDLAPLAGKRVCGIHPDDAADAVQDLAVV